MRSSFLGSFLVVVTLAGCGRGALAPAPEVPRPAVGEAARPPPPPPHVRLASTFEWGEGFRFGDRALVTTTTIPPARCGPATVVHTSGGVPVEGEAARVDLQAHLGRFLTLISEGGSICALDARVASLAEVDPVACTAWQPVVQVHVNAEPVQNAKGLGLVLRTERDGDFRLWISESGRDGGSDSAVVEFEALP